MKLDKFLKKFLAYAVLSFALSFSVLAAEICEQPTPSDPGEDVIEKTDPLNCAIKDGFQNSCAYREWFSGRGNKNAEKDAADYAERVSKLLDTNCDPKKFPANTCNLSSTEVEILQMLANQKFKDFYRRYTNGSPDGKDSSAITSAAGFSDSEVKRYKQLLKLLDGFDPIRTVKSSLLLSIAVDEEDKTFGPAEKKKIIEKTALEAFKFRAAQLEGCTDVKTRVRYRRDYTHSYGPISSGPGRSSKITQKEIEEYNAKSSEEAKKYQSIEGVSEDLKACGRGFSASYGTVAEIQSQCSVNLPMEVFADNASALSGKSQSVMMKALENDECFKKGKAARLPIARIAIATSANTLHNTKNYCRWEFDRLSADRGTMIQTAVVKGLGSEVGSAEFQIDSAGDRGDGSSGPCAYLAKEWKPGTAPKESRVFEVKTPDGIDHFFTEERNPKFNSPDEEKALEQYKYARVTIYYAEKVSPLTSKSYRQMSGTNCRKIEFTCQ